MANNAVNWTASTLRVPAGSYLSRDQGTATPPAEWAGPQELIITVSSKSRTGTIVSKHQELSVTRTYRAL